MNIFVYGTLMDPEIMQAVSGAYYAGRSATLHGYVRKRIAGEVYPAIIPDHGASVRGVLYCGVTAESLLRLDRFEGSQYDRHEVAVELENEGPMRAQTYVLAVACRGQLSNDDWVYQEFMQTGKAQLLKECHRAENSRKRLEP